MILHNLWHNSRQSFGFGDVIEVYGLAVAVPEGVVVQVKQPQGGWVFQKHGDRTLLEEVEPLKVSKKHLGGFIQQ